MKQNCETVDTIQPLCKCGCGRKINFDKRNKKWFLFCKGHGQKLHQFNRHTFENITTEEDAYWLGFFIADGFVKNKGTFGFCLGQKDLSHLEKFKKYINSTQPITITKNKKYVRLEISDKNYCEKILIQYGLVQGKSYGISLPYIGVNLMNHLIRGIFDGDGWVTSYKGRLSFGIIGHECLIRSIQILLVEECDLNWTKLYKDKRHSFEFTRSVCYGGKYDCEKIYDYLYEDATVYLERKKEKWNSIYEN